MTPDRADWHLANWATWMHASGAAPRGVRSLSLEGGFSVTDTEDLYDRSDRVAARATDAVIGGLTPEDPRREAIFSHYLGQPWLRLEPMTDHVRAAQVAVALGLERRGIV